MELKAAFALRHPGGPRVAAELCLDLGAPEVTVLFGPSGCGKTTVLRVLAGLARPEEGRIRAGMETWLDAASGLFVPPQARRLGCVFQEGALFPHLDAAANVAYGLRRLAQPAREARTAELLARVGLAGLGHRRPGELSGGQRQRLALARALAPEPRLLLLDEPFASLDRPAAEALRGDLRELLRASRVPAVLVTHDRDEALALGDRLLLMGEGCVLQEGPPAEVFARPASREAAERLGLDRVVRARRLGEREGLLRLGVGAAEVFAPDPGGSFREAYACFRPEGVALERDGEGLSTARNRLPGTVLALRPSGGLVRVTVDCGFPLDALVTAWACEELELAPGVAVTAVVKAAAIHVIPCPA